jgi:serine/threonine protein kinase/Flp pilus assembly protein TadD
VVEIKNWQKIEDLFHDALEQTAQDRAAYLAEACAGDVELRLEVESLLVAYEREQSFLEQPALSLGMKMMSGAAAGSLSGLTIGQYRILRVLGKGGAGEVYLAEDTRLGRHVALKFLPSYVTAASQGLLRFHQEARAASSISHPNVAHIYEAGAAEGFNYLAMEYVEGVTLREMLKGGKLELTRALDIALQVANALSAAHEAGVIHRDVKPENIMVRMDGYVKVLDFSLAKLSEAQGNGLHVSLNSDEPLETAPGLIMGTTPYMSPEQARGQTVDARTDIWSLAVVLYEMIEGRRLFDGESPGDVIASILTTEAPPLTNADENVSPELQVIFKKALRRKRDERYQSIKDLLTELQSLRKDLEFGTAFRHPPRGEAKNSVAQREENLSQDNSAKQTTGLRSTAVLPAVQATLSSESVLPGVKRLRLAGLSMAIAALILAAIGISVYLRAGHTAPALDSIAVLPFVNQNQDPNTEYLSDGLTESIINSLARLPNLRVIARSSIFSYKDKEIDPVAVGRELGVSAVLTGRILLRGETLIVNAELVDVNKNSRLWGEQYERKISDLLSVQPEIAKDISSNLRLKLSRIDETRVTRHYTQNPEAYQLYLKGRYFWNKRTSDDLKKAIEYFNQAIERDPNYALAYAGLADAYVLVSGYAAGSPEESFPKAKAAARKALSIDETLAEAHTSLAYVLFNYDWNVPESNQEFQRAIELNPNYATAHHWYGNANLLATGRFDEAVAELKRAQELDPLSLIINADLGTAYLFARRYDQAKEQLQKTLEMDRNFYYARIFLGRVHELKGSFQEAIVDYQKARELNDDPRVLTYLGHLYAVSGRREEAQKILNQMKELSKRRYVSAYYFAIVYTGLGEKDQAFQWLERGYQDHEGRMTLLKVEPYFDDLHTDPRFADLLRRVGL